MVSIRGLTESFPHSRNSNRPASATDHGEAGLPTTETDSACRRTGPQRRAVRCSNGARRVRGLPVSYCGAAYPIVKEIQKQLGTKLRFVFRNFPITTSHPQAEWAAETAEAAAVQGRFWEMHDFLYENQVTLGDHGFFADYERKLKLDVKRRDQEE